MNDFIKIPVSNCNDTAKGGAKLLQDAPFSNVPVLPLVEASYAFVPLPSFK